MLPVLPDPQLGRLFASRWCLPPNPQVDFKATFKKRERGGRSDQRDAPSDCEGAPRRMPGLLSLENLRAHQPPVRRGAVTKLAVCSASKTRSHLNKQRLSRRAGRGAESQTPEGENRPPDLSANKIAREACVRFLNSGGARHRIVFTSQGQGRQTSQGAHGRHGRIDLRRQLLKHLTARVVFFFLFLSLVFFPQKTTALLETVSFKEIKEKKDKTASTSAQSQARTATFFLGGGDQRELVRG